MHLTLKETKEEIYASQRVSKHVSPHLHNALEIVCVTEGTLEMGVGQELYHMEKGDIGFVFPILFIIIKCFQKKQAGQIISWFRLLLQEYLKIKYKDMLLNIRLLVRDRLSRMFTMHFRRLSKWTKKNL